MTELSNEPSIQEEDAGAERTPSTGVMLVSILLLIAGFLLASAMLIHYGLEGKPQKGCSRPGFAQTLEKVKGMVASAKPDAGTPPPEQPRATVSKPKDTGTKDAGTKGFFRGSRGGVRWPRLELTGFGIPADGEIGFAIINGKYVVEGGEANGTTVVEIFEHGVRVEYKGETKTLAIDLTH